MMTGEELKALRNSLGLSVTAASRQVEASARSWQRWESGQQPIPAGVLKLFRILNGLEEIPPKTRSVRVDVTNDVKTVSAVGYVRDPDDGKP